MGRKTVCLSVGTYVTPPGWRADPSSRPFRHALRRLLLVLRPLWLVSRPLQFALKSLFKEKERSCNVTTSRPERSSFHASAISPMNHHTSPSHVHLTTFTITVYQHTSNITRSLSVHRTFTTALSPTHLHHRTFTIACPPSHVHHRTFAITRSLSHVHLHTSTITRSLSVHRTFTIARSPSHVHHRTFAIINF